MKVVSKFHSPSTSSLGGVREKPPSGIKRYSFIYCREEEIEINASYEAIVSQAKKVNVKKSSKDASVPVYEDLFFPSTAYKL